MTFNSGHPFYPPKSGDIPGRNRASSRAARLLASAVRDSVDADALAAYHFAIACGHMNVRLAESGDAVRWDDSEGSPPTQAEISESVKWLSDRGWGQPAQSVHVEASFRAELGATKGAPAIGVLPASVLHAMSELLAGASGASARALPAPASASHAARDADAIDAEFIDVASASDDTSDAD